MKKPGLVLLMFFSFLNLIAQNQLFKGKNLLIPSNLIVNYTVRLDTCYRMVNGECIEHISKAYLKNKSENDLIGMLVDSVLSGKVNCFKADSWLTYQIMDNRQKLSASEIESKLNNTESNKFDKKQIVGFNFVEDWEVTTNPLAFKKKVIAYMPLRCYYCNDDSCYENPLYQIPFTIVDTLISKKQIKKSEKRMILSNEIAYEYFFYLDYNFPYDIDELSKTYKRFGHIVDNYSLRKETSEYLTPSGIINCLKILIDRVIQGKLTACDFYDNHLLLLSEVEERMGAIKDTIENVNSTVTHPLINTMDFEEIQSVVFLEKWYIDPVTFRMEKKVVGIAPVRHYYSENDEQEENLKRQILFKIYFDEKEKF